MKKKELNSTKINKNEKSTEKI